MTANCARPGPRVRDGNSIPHRSQQEGARASWLHLADLLRSEPLKDAYLHRAEQPSGAIDQEQPQRVSGSPQRVAACDAASGAVSEEVSSAPDSRDRFEASD